MTSVRSLPNAQFQVGLLLLILSIGVTAAAQDLGLELWIPSQLDDWKALSAEAALYEKKHAPIEGQTTAALWANSNPSFTTHPPIFPIPTPPSDLPRSEVLTLAMFVSGAPPAADGSSSAAIYGRTVVWRGSEGKPIAATIYIEGPAYVRQMKDRAPTKPSDFAAVMEKIKAVTAPAPGWTIRHERDCLAVVWERPKGRVMTRDEREGPAGVLRPEDVRWLSSAPAPVLAQVNKTKAPADYLQRRAACVPAAEGLARYRAGFPQAPVLIGNVVSGSQAEKMGIQVGDALVAIDGIPISIQHFWYDGIGLKKADQSGPAASVRLARIGQSLIDLAVLEPGARMGISAKEGPIDLGMDVLALTAPLGPEALADVAVVLYGVSDPQLTAWALDRLPTKMPTLTAFLSAWTAAASGDAGRVDQLLSDAVIAKAGRLGQVMAVLRDGVRKRSGRYLLAFPKHGADLDHARRLAAMVPETQRFALFDGLVQPGTFTQDATASIVGLDRRCTQILAEAGGTIATTISSPQLRVEFGSLPEIVEITATFTIEPTTYTTTNAPDYASAIEHYVAFRFAERRPVRGSLTEGYGKAKLWTNGMCDFDAATLRSSEKEFPPRMLPGPLPLQLGAGKVNTLRVIRWKQMQRTEINGICAYQGFLFPFEVASPPSEVSFGLECRGVTLVLGQVRFATPAGAGKPSDF